MHSTTSPRRPPRVSLTPPPPAGRPASLSHHLPPAVGLELGSALQTPTAVRSKIREIFMPALSSTMTEGKIVSWIKSEGDKLSKVVVVGSQLHHDRGSLPLVLFLGTIGFL
ncbi:dihydrolipoyllysine-residue acetyltransferase component 5 of pyruvate dehydrogenase complex, chloroplastic [Fagus crenata]